MAAAAAAATAATAAVAAVVVRMVVKGRTKRARVVLQLSMLFLALRGRPCHRLLVFRFFGVFFFPVFPGGGLHALVNLRF